MPGTSGLGQPRLRRGVDGLRMGRFVDIRAVQQLRAPGPRPSPRRPSLPGTGAAARQGPPSGAQWRETPDVSTHTGKQLPSRPGERPTWQETPVVSTHIGLPLPWVMRRFATEGLPTGKSRQGPIPKPLPLTGRCSHRALAAIGRRDNGTVGRPPRECPHVALGVVRDCQYSAFLGSLPEGRTESGRMWLGTPPRAAASPAVGSTRRPWLPHQWRRPLRFVKKQIRPAYVAVAAAFHGYTGLVVNSPLAARRARR